MEPGSRVTERDVFWIAKILSNAYDVVINTNRLCGALGFLPVQIEEIKRNCMISGLGSYEVLSRIITEWICSGGDQRTLAELLRILRDENFNSAADELVKAAKKQVTGHRSNPNPSPSPNRDAQPDILAEANTGIVPDDFPLTEKQMMHVRDRIVEDIVAITSWTTVKDWILEKPVDKFIIEKMLENPGSIEHTILKTLQLWKGREREKATFGTLVSIFDENNFKHLCNDLKEKKENIWRNVKS